MPLIDTQALKEAIGLAPNDNTQDAKLELSVNNANALIAGYIGADLSDVDTEVPFIETVDQDARHMRLPVFPVISIESVSADGNTMDPSNYMLNPRLGMLDFPMGIPNGQGQQRWGHRMLVVFKAGYEDIPQDLSMACLNMAAAIYNLGGTFASASGGTGALKSLTMFDAMAMSFDVGGQNANGAGLGTPEAMIASWKFVLDKYRVNGPTAR